MTFWCLKALLRLLILHPQLSLLLLINNRTRVEDTLNKKLKPKLKKNKGKIYININIYIAYASFNTNLKIRWNGLFLYAVLSMIFYLMQYEYSCAPKTSDISYPLLFKYECTNGEEISDILSKHIRIYIPFDKNH